MRRDQDKAQEEFEKIVAELIGAVMNMDVCNPKTFINMSSLAEKSVSRMMDVYNGDFSYTQDEGLDEKG